ncbi:MAG: PAS domain S-box protein [Anaerosomatales bacterium]|nr:PAS domain S-box protein [Anaerosomatales bacterium]
MYREIFENRHVVMFIIDPATGEIVDANAAAERFYGWSRETLRTMRITEINALSPAEVQAEMDRARTERRKQFYFPHRLADGRVRNVEVYSGPVEIDGRSLLYSFVFDMTEREDVQRELATEAIKRRVLVEQARDGICLIGPDRSVIEANRSFAEMLGRELDDVIGMHPWEWDARLDTREAVLDLWPEMTHEAAIFETQWRRADGTLLDVEVSATPIEIAGERCVMNMCRDMTRRKAAEERARRWERVFDTAEFGLARVSTEDDTFLEVNRAFAEERGYTPGELVGQSLFALYPPERRESAAKHVRTIDKRGHLRFETEHWRKDGTSFPVLLEVATVPDAQGRPESRVVYAIDISDRKAAEVELQHVNASLEEQVRARTEELERAVTELTDANAQLVEANEVKSRFLRSMSHELRTPLNSIIGFSDMLLRELAGPVEDEQRRQLEMINHSGRHLLALINDVLDLSRIEADRLVLEWDDVAPGAVAREAFSAIVPSAAEKGVELTLAVGDELDDAVIRTDSRRVRQILLNLLGNAVKFTSEGSVTLEVRRAAPGMVAFAVTDTGPGIPVERHEDIFGEFTQHEHGLDPEERGTGLGLAISRGLAVLLGGAVTLRSAPGEGSTFTLLLPERTASAEESDENR